MGSGGAAEFRRVVRAAVQARLNAPEHRKPHALPTLKSHTDGSERSHETVRDNKGRATTHIPNAGYVEKRAPAAKFRTATRARSIMFAGSSYSGNQPKSL